MALPLLAELNRRRVFRALVVYGVVAFAVLQIIEPVMHGLHWPDPVLSYIVVGLALGFPVVVGLAWAFDVTSAGIEWQGPAGNLRGARLYIVLAAIGLLAAAPGLGWYFLRQRIPLEPARPPAVAAPPSIAVLAFADMSPDRDQEYFADGISEEILNALAHVDGLRVPGRTSSFYFKGKSAKLSDIGREIRVGSVLEGSVRKEGNRVRITAQLVKIDDESHIWSETYERELTGVFAVQDEIARSVVSALKLKLVPGAARPSERPRNPEAYNHCLLGRHFRYTNPSPESEARALQQFEKSVALDPGYAPAWAFVSLSLSNLAGYAENMTAENERRALAAAEKAIWAGQENRSRRSTR